MTEKLKEIVELKLKNKTWTFAEITNVQNLVDELCDSAYGTMTGKEKLDLVWEIDIEEGLTFGSFFQGLVEKRLADDIAIILKDELSSATVAFKESNKNEISKRSVGGESHKERTTNEKTDSA